jgi:hypothetical protein
MILVEINVYLAEVSVGSDRLIVYILGVYFDF